MNKWTERKICTGYCDNEKHGCTCGAQSANKMHDAFMQVINSIEYKNERLFDENIELKKDIRDLNSHLNSLRDSMPKDGLVDLDINKLMRCIQEVSTTHTYPEIAEYICYKFGTKPVPSVEKMEKYLSECKAWQALWLEVPAEIMEHTQPLIAQAIHDRIKGDGK
jgi:hypothetical protein